MPRLRMVIRKQEREERFSSSKAEYVCSHGRADYFVVMHNNIFQMAGESSVQANTQTKVHMKQYQLL